MTAVSACCSEYHVILGNLSQAKTVDWFYENRVNLREFKSKYMEIWKGNNFSFRVKGAVSLDL